MMRRIRIDAPAKVNLRLGVLAREASGYHTLETILCGIDLADRLEIVREAPGIRLEVDGDIDTGPGERNLATRAAEAFFASTGEPPDVTIRLAKRIPAAAGLGGGSSDAAATLRGLNALYGRPCSPRRLLELGAALGSDVPFFLTPTPHALAWGRGQRLLSLPPLPTRPLLVAHPGESMPTPAAFARLADLREGAPAAPPSVFGLEALGDWTSVATLAVNDLELPAFEKIPRIPHAARTFLEHGAILALLAGSGSAVFGVFEEDGTLEDAAREVGRMGFRTWRCRTLERWPAVEE